MQAIYFWAGLAVILVLLDLWIINSVWRSSKTSRTKLMDRIGDPAAVWRRGDLERRRTAWHNQRAIVTRTQQGLSPIGSGPVPNFYPALAFQGVAHAVYPEEGSSCQSPQLLLIA